MPADDIDLLRLQASSPYTRTDELLPASLTCKTAASSCSVSLQPIQSHYKPIYRLGHFALQ